jgi:AcrR family transcriptional regulator
MNTIQEERVRGFFINAAKELIRGEGLVTVSARNVAERAGYSYATLYNYFKDIRDLIFSCVEDFMAECRSFVLENSRKKSSPDKNLAEISKNYVKFFVQYPGIFDLLFHQKASQISTAGSNFKSIYLLLDSLTEECWMSIGKENNLNEKKLKAAQENHKLALHGLLMVFLNNRKDLTFEQLLEKTTELSSFALQSLSETR